MHQIRNFSKYLSYKDLKAFNSDLKLVYKAVNEETAVAELDKLEEKWKSKYLIVIKSWRNNWDELATFFKYPPEIRKIIYTTNAIESYNRQLRKVTKSNQVMRGWAQILAQLSIYFDRRLDNQLF